MKTSKLTYTLIIGIILTSCNLNNIDFIPDPENNWFPDGPINLAGLNTEYDDYNSNIERTGRGFDLYFSSNKNSKNKDFDIVCARFKIYVNPETQEVEFEIIKDHAFWDGTILPKVNSMYNELGPFSFDWKYNKTDLWGNWCFMYANDSTGNYDIKFTNINIYEWAHGGTKMQKVYGPVNSKVLNSAFDDFYPTINKNLSQLYFSSNRNGDFDIFKVDIPGSDIISWLETGNEDVQICNNLSSEYDDKCTYINGNLLVFASNRKNGYGGFDLWYSKYENNAWSEPVNFGPNINTRFDEYRPAIEYYEDSKNDLMIFSSNRPQGNGGFDLYYTGINKMIK